MLIKKFPDEDHGHGVEFAVAEQRLAQCVGHVAVAEHQFVVGSEGCATVGNGHVVAHVLEHIVIDDRDPEQTANRRQQVIRILDMARRIEGNPCDRFGRGYI